MQVQCGQCAVVHPNPVNPVNPVKKTAACMALQCAHYELRIPNDVLFPQSPSHHGANQFAKRSAGNA
jgi:hypothetical protein